MIKSKQVKLYMIMYNPTLNVPVEEFAKSFLAIYNNVRENTDAFLDMQLNRDSTLYFITRNNKEFVEHITDWMYTNFSEVWSFNRTIEVERTVIQDDEDYLSDDIRLNDNVDIEEL